MTGSAGGCRVLVAHPSAELYGSDRMLLASVEALAGSGWAVTVALPVDGPLVPLLEEAGARVVLVPGPVLRRGSLTPLGLVGLAVTFVRTFPALLRLLRQAQPDVVHVNTLVLPSWLLAARLAGRPAVCHVHEAEEGLGRALALALHAPLLLARRVLVNSAAAREALAAALPGLQRRTVLLYNGVAGPPRPPRPPRAALAAPLRLLLVGRLSPRKGTDVAVAAAGLLARRGHDVRLQLAGEVFPGYEWFAEDLRRQVADGSLQEVVDLLGFQPDVWPLLERADVVLVPSRVEPFGNVAVEAGLAGRPVVASSVQGLREIVRDGVTGLLVPPGDAPALADAVERLVDDWPGARRLAEAARADALLRFGVDRYGAELAAVLGELARPDGVPGVRR